MSARFWIDGMTPASKDASLLDLIGHTPMVKVRHIDTGVCELFLKLESQNPGGSVKDRIALNMIEEAERSDKLKPGGTLVEATSGNAGVGVTFVGRQKGYRVIIVVIDKASQEKIAHMKSLGAEIVIAPSNVPHDHPDSYFNQARRITAQTPGAFFVNQFANPANPAAHEKSTGPEIWEQMSHKVDAIVCGVGTGGTMTGVGRYFQRVSPQTEMILADPQGSSLAPFFNTGNLGECGSWLVEGIGEDFVPKNLDMSLVKKAYTIPDRESIAVAREVLAKEGILAGLSSGTLIGAALRYCREQKEPKRVVSFVCDSGAKYMSKLYNPEWLKQHGMDDIP